MFSHRSGVAYIVSQAIFTNRIVFFGNHFEIDPSTSYNSLATKNICPNWQDMVVEVVAAP